MIRTLVTYCLTLIPVVLIACAGGEPRWGHFHGGLANRGFQEVEGGYALSPAWVSAPYAITSSSPVIGRDYKGSEVLYVGTIDGKLLAINTLDGTLLWKRNLSPKGTTTSIVSSPAAAGNGDIYIITNLETDSGRVHSTLHKINALSLSRWSFELPNNGFTTGSPKVYRSETETLVFVSAMLPSGLELQSELFVLRDRVDKYELLDHKPLGRCQISTGSDGTGSEYAAAFQEIWEYVTKFPVKSDDNGIALPPVFIDPTPAIFVTEQKNLMIAITDNACNIGAFKWSGTQLSAMWHHSHPPGAYSSPVVLGNGLMVFGRQEGVVEAYEVVTGKKIWNYDAGEPVLATPAVTPDHSLFLVSRTRIHVLDGTNGNLIKDTSSPGQLEFSGPTYASPALTEDRVYISAREMITVSHDLKARVYDTSYRGNGLSSVTVGDDGSVYTVAHNGTIRKYQGTD